MKCNELEEILSAYVDGEIGGRKAAEVRTHLSGCESCSRRLEALEVLQGKLGEMMSEKLNGPDLSDLVMVSLPVRRRSVLPRLAWTIAGTAIAAVAFWQSVPLANRPHAKTPQVAVNAPLDRGEKHKGTESALRLKPAVPAPDEKHVAPKPQRPDEAASTAWSGKPKPNIRRPGSVHAHEHGKAPQAEPTGPIRVVASTKAVNGTTETTIEIIAGSVIVSRTRTIEVQIARDDNAATVERPPLEVVRNSPPVGTGATGG